MLEISFLGLKNIALKKKFVFIDVDLSWKYYRFQNYGDTCGAILIYFQTLDQHGGMEKKVYEVRSLLMAYAQFESYL